MVVTNWPFAVVIFQCLPPALATKPTRFASRRRSSAEQSLALMTSLRAMRQDEGDLSLDRTDRIGVELLRHLDGRQVGGHIGEVLRRNLEVGASGIVYHVEEFREAFRLGLHAGDRDHGRHEAAVCGTGDLYRKLLRESGPQALNLKLCLLGELHVFYDPWAYRSVKKPLMRASCCPPGRQSHLALN